MRIAPPAPPTEGAGASGDAPVGGVSVGGAPVGGIPVGGIPVGGIPVGDVPVGDVLVDGTPIGRAFPGITSGGAAGRLSGAGCPPPGVSGYEIG